MAFTLLITFVLVVFFTAGVLLQRMAELELASEAFVALESDARQHPNDAAKLHETILFACSGVMTGATGSDESSGSPLVDKLSKLSKAYVDVVEQNEKLRADIQNGGRVAPAEGRTPPLPQGWEMAVEPGSDYVCKDLDIAVHSEPHLELPLGDPPGIASLASANVLCPPPPSIPGCTI